MWLYLQGKERERVLIISDFKLKKITSCSNVVTAMHIDTSVSLYIILNGIETMNGLMVKQVF